MTPSPEIFPVPLIHISETNSTNNYLQTLCARQKVEELTTVEPPFQFCAFPCFLGSALPVFYFADYIFGY